MAQPQGSVPAPQTVLPAAASGRVRLSGCPAERCRLRLSTGTAGGIPLVRIEGDVDTDDAPDLQRALWDAFGGGTQIVLDLEACTHVSSTGLAVLFSVTHWGRAKRGRVIGIRPSPDLARLFRLVGLTKEGTFQLVVDPEDVNELLRSEQLDKDPRET
jgi:anti-anti-sigma factor